MKTTLEYHDRKDLKQLTSKLKRFFDIAIVLLQKDLKVRYKSTVFGYLWSIGHPFAFALVFFVAFKVVMRIQVEDYVFFLISGLFPWQWFSNSLQASPTLFLSNASIIKKVNFPRNLLPFTLVFQDMIHYLFSIPVILLFGLIYNRYPSLHFFWGIPILLFIQCLMTYGLSLIISSINLFFRDLERLTSIALTLVFYFTPVIYPETMVPEQFQQLLHLNPVASLIVNWRNLFLYQRLDVIAVSISLGYSLGFFLTGHLLYRKLSWRFAEVL